MKNKMTKRIMSIMLAVIMVAALGVTAFAASTPFKDVNDPAVTWCYKRGIINGTTNTTFSPQQTITRAQAITMLWRMAGSPNVSGKNPFKDVSSNQYYYKAVIWGVKKGIVSGTSDTTFTPNHSCTRGQILTFIYRAVGKPYTELTYHWKDVDIYSYCYNAIGWAYENHILASEDITGTPRTAFNPQGGALAWPDTLLSRLMMARFLYRVNQAGYTIK